MYFPVQLLLKYNKEDDYSGEAMARQIEETVAQRRAYVDQIRATFYPEEPSRGNTGKEPFQRNAPYSQEQGQEGGAKYSSLGIRTLVAVLLFAAFIYCDKKQVSFYQYKTADVWKQIEWNPLPLEELEETIKMSIKSGKH